MREKKALKERRKPVEQRFDDCGEDLSSLHMPEQTSMIAEFLFVSDGDLESDTDDDIACIANAFAQWAIASTLEDGQPPLHFNSFLAVDIDEMFAILSEPAHKGYGVEIVEICGGNALTSLMCVHRKLHSGHCFELVTGTDLTVPAIQHRVLGYLDVARPLVIVMSPICTPFGPLGQRNSAS